MLKLLILFIMLSTPCLANDDMICTKVKADFRIYKHPKYKGNSEWISRCENSEAICYMMEWGMSCNFK